MDSDRKPALPHWDVGLIFPKWTFEDSTEKCKDFFRLGRLGSRTSRPAVVTDDARRDARHRRLCLPPSFPFVAAAFLGIAPSRESFLSLFPLILASGPKIARYLFGVLLGPARHCVCGLDQYVQHDAKKNKQTQPSRRMMRTGVALTNYYRSRRLMSEPARRLHGYVG